MSDLLGSILKTMEKPPSIGVKEEQKKQAEQLRKIQEEEKKQLLKFRKDIQLKLEAFINDESKSSYKFEAMDKVHRTITHDVADILELATFTFGIENIDRHTVVYKKDSVPSEEELAALRRGEVYDPTKEKMKKVLEYKEELESRKKLKETKPVNSYKDKYEHLIGKDAGLEAAVATKLNQQFGIVPSSLKRDQRSIEETLNDIRKKKFRSGKSNIDSELNSNDKETTEDD